MGALQWFNPPFQHFRLSRSELFPIMSRNMLMKFGHFIRRIQPTHLFPWATSMVSNRDPIRAPLMCTIIGEQDCTQPRQNEHFPDLFYFSVSSALGFPNLFVVAWNGWWLGPSPGRVQWVWPLCTAAVVGTYQESPVLSECLAAESHKQLRPSLFRCAWNTDKSKRQLGQSETEFSSSSPSLGGTCSVEGFSSAAPDSGNKINKICYDLLSKWQKQRR